MKHLICDSVYSNDAVIPSLIRETDHVELLTGYSPVSGYDLERVESVHLPYSTDWYGVWSGERRITDDVDDASIPFMYYGSDKDEIVQNMIEAIQIAQPLKPQYGVLHACNANFDELLCRTYSDSDSKILSAFAEMMNEVASSFGGDMPFELALENLWWPGMRMVDTSCYRFLESHLEFDNWSICLDTGHLLIVAGGSDSESESIELLNHIVDRYQKDVLDRIRVTHLHNNTSRLFARSFVAPDDFCELGHMGRYSAAYRFICELDQHRPFTDPSIVGFVERISPEFVNHEMGAVNPLERVSDYNIQRSLFKKDYI